MAADEVQLWRDRARRWEREAKRLRSLVVDALAVAQASGAGLERVNDVEPREGSRDAA